MERLTADILLGKYAAHRTTNVLPMVVSFQMQVKKSHPAASVEAA